MIGCAISLDEVKKNTKGVYPRDIQTRECKSYQLGSITLKNDFIKM